MEEFINEFKHLEKLCNDMYGQPHGVTLYINEMEAASHEAGGIAGWSDDFKNLKRLRHIRNNLVHDPEYEPDYDAEDIEYLKDFYRRIIDQQDPLSLLRAKRMSRNKQLKLDLANGRRGKGRRKSNIISVILTVVAIICVIVIGVVAVILINNPIGF